MGFLISMLKTILRYPFKEYKRWKNKRFHDHFQKHGFEALAQFDSCLNRHNIDYSLAFGTLLGAIREHDFIPHDDDIDIAMWIDDYTPDLRKYLEEDGFELKHSFTVDNDKFGKEDTYYYNGVQLDIFYFYKGEEGTVYCCDFVNMPGCSTREKSLKKYGCLLPRKLFLPLTKDVIRTSFKGIKVSVPSNYEEILSFRYGSDYMTPKVGWRPNTKYIVPQENKRGIYYEY